MSKKNNKILSSEYDTTIALMDIYLAEWIERDARFWEQVFKYFYVALIVMLLPNVSGMFSLNLPPLPEILFRLFGIILSIFFLYVSIGYGKRLEAIGITYSDIIDKLPEGYRRKKISDLKCGRFFKCRLSYVITISMFSALLIIEIILLAFS